MASWSQIRAATLVTALLASNCGLDRLDGLSSEPKPSVELPVQGGSTAAGQAGISNTSGTPNITAGGGGYTGATGGEAGSAGLNASSGGTDVGGASAGSAGGNNAGAAGDYVCSTAGAASTPEPCTGDDCKMPEGIRVLGATGTRFGGSGGNLVFDLCLEDEAVIAINWVSAVPTEDFRGSDPRMFHIQLECGKLNLSGTGPYTVTPTFTRTLLRRGRTDTPRQSELAGRAACPENHVLVGLQGKYGAITGATNYTPAIKELKLLCAPLTITTDETGHSISVGAAVALDPFGTVAGEAIPDQSQCGDGEFARGVQMRAGRWIDAMGVVCGTPKLTYPVGAPCNDRAACQSGVCDTTCQPEPPCGPCDCTCLSYELNRYAFCGIYKLSASANQYCQAAGEHLVQPRTLAESGWLRSAAGALGLNGGLWIGVEYANGSWQYSDAGGEVPISLQVPKSETFWRENEPNALETEHCAEVSFDGAWNNLGCSLVENVFACQR